MVTSARPAPRRPQLILRIELASGRLGPGKIELLEHIREDRSLAAAARAMSMSYKRAWELLRALNQMFEQPVARSLPGRKLAGATTLTPFGEHLIALYRALEQRTQRACAAGLDELTAASRKPPRARRSPSPASQTAQAPRQPLSPPAAHARAPAPARRRAARPT